MEFHLAVFCVMLFVAATFVRAQEGDRSLDVDIDEILGDKGQVDAYIKCFLDEEDEDCNEIGRRVKALLPRVLPTGCGQCSAKERAAMAKAAGFLARQRPDAWRALQTKFDPEGAYAAAHPDIGQ